MMLHQKYILIRVDMDLSKQHLTTQGKKIRLLIIGKDSFIPSNNLFNKKNKICIKKLNILNLLKKVTNFYLNSNIFLIVICVKNNQKNLHGIFNVSLGSKVCFS